MNVIHMIVVGACITACRGTGRNILAFEGNTASFSAMREPLNQPPTNPEPAPTPIVALDLTLQGDDVPIVPRKFTRKTKSSK